MRADAEANRRDLLAAASRLIATEGAGVSLRSVAQAAGVGIGTLYRHFPTREDLVSDLFVSVAGEVTAAAERFQASDADVSVKWGAFVHELAALGLGALAVPLRESHPELPRNAKVVEARQDTLADVTGVVDVAKAHRLVRADIAPETFFVGLVAITRRLPEDLLREVQDPTSWIVDVYLLGLRTDG